MNKYENSDALRVFSIGQIVASILGGIGDGLITIFIPQVPIGLILVCCTIAAAGGAFALLLLARGQFTAAAYTFVLAAVAAITLSFLILGVRTGVPAFFVWPAATASLLMGLGPGIGIAVLCSAITIIWYIQQSQNALIPLLSGEATVVIGVFAAVLSLSLVVIAATVAGSSIRQALSETENKAEELAYTLAQLQEKVKQEEKVTVTVEALAEGLVESSTQQRSSATTAASAIAEVSAQVSELAAAAAEIATAAKLIREVGERAQEMAEDARNRLDHDRDQLNQAVRAGEQMQVAARQVDDNIRQMGRIINLITEVAEETHMLSLNATIEATGTGESGRRFRVIAAEVGNLANKVNTSTEQVAAMVQVVQRTVQVMLTSANQTVDSIKRSQVSNAATGEQVEQVAEAADNVAREGFLIVSSTEQQRRTSELIANSLEEVSSVARQAASSSEQLSTVASNLRVAVDQLGAALPRELPPVASSDSGAGGGAPSLSRPTTRLAPGATPTPNQA